MKIKFNGHAKSTREVELSQEDLAKMFELMRQEFLDSITFGTFSGHNPLPSEKNILDFCDKFGVDGQYSKDRIAFFTEVLKMNNPYLNTSKDT